MCVPFPFAADLQSTYTIFLSAFHARRMVSLPGTIVAMMAHSGTVEKFETLEIFTFDFASLLLDMSKVVF